MLSKSVLDTALFHNGICGMPGFDHRVNREVSFSHRTVLYYKRLIADKNSVLLAAFSRAASRVTIPFLTRFDR